MGTKNTYIVKGKKTKTCWKDDARFGKPIAVSDVSEYMDKFVMSVYKMSVPRKKT